jgi:hypothetical protein
LFLPVVLRADAITACTEGTLASYMGTSCSEGGVTFSNFNFYSSIGGTATIAADQIRVTPVISGTQVGLRFDVGGLMAQSGLTMPWVDFTVTSSGTLTSGSFSSVQGVADSGADVFLCPGGTSNTCSPDQMVIVRAIRDNPAGTTKFAAGVSTVEVHSLLIPGRDQMVEYDFNAEGGSGSSVPEPAASALLGAGLLAFTYLARRRRRA